MKTLAALTLLLLSALAAGAQWFGDNWVQINTNTTDLVADGRPETVTAYAGQSAQAGWQRMSDSEIRAALAATATVQRRLQQVVGTVPKRQLEVSQELERRMGAGTWEPRELRVAALLAETAATLVQVNQLQAEFTRLLLKGVNLTAFWSNLSTAESNRLVELRSMMQIGTGDDLTAKDKARAANGMVQLRKVVALWEYAKSKRLEIETNTVEAVSPLEGWPELQIED